MQARLFNEVDGVKGITSGLARFYADFLVLPGREPHPALASLAFAMFFPS